MTYDELLGSLGEWWVGPVLGDLQERSGRRGANLLDIMLYMRPIWVGLNQVRHAIDWMADVPGLSADVSSLLHQAGERIVLGMESLLSETGPRALDESRSLMEVEYLLYDFTADPSGLERWGSAEPFRRHNDFNFGRLRRRQEARLQAGSDQVLGVRNEYRVHSYAVHPRPAAEINLEVAFDPEQRRSSLLMDVADLFQHAHRVWSAACGYVLSIEDEIRGIATADDEQQTSEIREDSDPCLDMVDAAFQMIADYNGRLGVPRRDTPFVSVTEDGSDMFSRRDDSAG